MEMGDRREVEFGGYLSYVRKKKPWPSWKVADRWSTVGSPIPYSFERRGREEERVVRCRFPSSCHGLPPPYIGEDD
jgi:hypothetical protein